MNEFVMLICDFILPRQILLSYGSDVNGLVTSITQFLGFIALTEMGVGAVVKSALYKPLATGDEAETSRILKSAGIFFHKIGRILVLYVALLCVIFPFISESVFDYAFIIPLIIAVSISSIAQYYFGIVNQLLLTADQRSYVYLLLNSVSMVVNTAASVFLMRAGVGIQTVKFAAAIVLLIKPIGMAVYVNRHYVIDRAIELHNEPIKQKWNGIAQHIAAFVLSHTDVIVLTTFSTFKNVSIYNTYYIVVAGMRRLLTTAMTGVDALFGNLYAKNDPALQSRNWKEFRTFGHRPNTSEECYLALLLTVNDMIKISRTFQIVLAIILMALLVAAYGAYCIRLPYNTMVLAAGHYKETQTSAIIEAVLNVVISIILVRKYGLYGVAVGTLIAMLYRSCYLALYLSKAIMYRPFTNYLKHILVDAIVIVLVVFSTRWMLAAVNGYLEWIILAIKVFIVAAVEVVIINGVIYNTEFRDTIKTVKLKRK